MNVVALFTESVKTQGKIRLAAYCRVSSNSDEQLHSFAAQIRYYKDYERKHPEYCLVNIYADEGLTGTEAGKRNELQRLLRDCKDGKIDRIVVKSISRLARNTTELLTILRLLKTLNVSVYFEEQGIDSDKLNSEMIVTFPGMAAQQESMTISGNMRWSYQKRMASGEFNGTYPAYGYRLIDGELSIKEDEAEIVREIFQRYLQGSGKQAIANTLAQQGIPCRGGFKVWYASTIHYILNNERYMGDAVLQKFYTTETLPFKGKRNHGEKQQYYIENANPPIVSRETFQAVQALQQQRFKKSNTPKPASCLRGVLRCADCGRTYRRYLVDGKAYWLCCKKATGAAPCSSRRISELAVQATFRRMIFKLCTNRQILLAPLLRDLEAMQSKSSKFSALIQQLDSKIADLSARKLVIVRLHNNGILNAADYAARSAAVSSQVTLLRSERKRRLAETAADSQLDQLRELDALLREYTTQPFADETLCSQVVERITVRNATELSFHLIGGITFTETVDP